MRTRPSGRARTRARQAEPERSVVLEAEADLHAHLVVLDGAVLDLTAHLRHLEPVEVAQRAGGPLDAVADGAVDAVGGGADDLGDAVGAVGDVASKARWEPDATDVEWGHGARGEAGRGADPDHDGRLQPQRE